MVRAQGLDAAKDFGRTLVAGLDAPLKEFEKKLSAGVRDALKNIGRESDRHFGGLGRTIDDVSARLDRMNDRLRVSARLVRELDRASVAGAAGTAGHGMDQRRVDRLQRMGLLNAQASSVVQQRMRTTPGYAGPAAAASPAGQSNAFGNTNAQLHAIHRAVINLHHTVRQQGGQGGGGGGAGGGAGGGGFFGLGGGGGSFGAFNRLGNFAIRASALTYLGQNVLRGVREVVTAPSSAIMEATSRARDFERAIVGVAGGFDHARAVSEELIRSSSKLPATLAELRDIGAEMARIPALSTRVAMGTPSQAARQIEQFAELATAMASLDEKQGVSGFLVAAREALAGGPDALRSMRLRLEIPPDLLAAMVGRPRKELTADPRLLMEALTKYRETYIPQSAIDDRGNKYGLRLAKVAEQWENVLRRIGEGGFYDHAIGRLRQLSDALAEYEQSPVFAGRAKGISSGLGRMMDNLGLSLLKFLGRLSGAKDLLSTPDAIAEAVEGFATTLARWSDGLPELAERAGTQLRGLTSALGEAVAEIQRLHELAKGNPVPAAGNAYLAGIDRYAVGLKDDARVAMGMKPADRSWRHFAIDFLDEKWLRLDPEERERRRLEALLGQLRGLGFKGGQISEMVSTTPLPLGLTMYQTLSQFDPKGMPVEQARLAEQLMRAWEGVDGAATGDRDALLSIARGSVTDLDERLRRVLPQQTAVQAVKTLLEQVEEIARVIPRDIQKLEPSTFRAKFQGMQGAVFRVGETYREEEDRFGYASASARTHMRELFNAFKLDPKDPEEKAGDLLDKIGQFRDTWARKIDQAVADLEKLGPSPEADAKVIQLQGARRRLVEGHKVEYDATVKNLITTGRNYGLGIAQTLDGESAPFQNFLLRRVMAGDTEDVARRIGNRIGLSRDDRRRLMGLPSFPAHEQAQILRQAMDAAEGEVGTFGSRFGSRMSPGDLRRLVLGRTDYGAGRALLNALGEMRPDAARLYAERRNAYAGAPTEDNFRALSEAGVLVADLEQRMLDLRRAQGDVAVGFRDFGAALDESVLNGFADGVYRLVSGTGTLKETLVGFAQDVQRAWSQMLANTVAKQILGTGFEGLFSSVFSRGTARAGSTAGHESKHFDWGGMNAKGNLFTRPTIAGLGERGPEAIMPLGRLPDGSLGVRTFGGGGRERPVLSVVVDNRDEAARVVQQARAVDPSVITQIVDLAEQRVARNIAHGTGAAGNALKKRRYG